MLHATEVEEKLILDACRNDLLSYCMTMYPRFVNNNFAEAIAGEIQNCIEGDTDRLMIFAPPRHGKSFVTSETAPAWFLGKYPDKKVIAASHTARLSEDMGMLVRNNINNPVHHAAFGPRAAIDKQKAAADNFRTMGGGQFFGVGVGGTPIGKGADLYIIDDPIRSRDDVESEKQRDDLKSWYSSAVLSRLEGKGKIILMHQRWHPDDLAGYLLREHADDGWRVVSFPAIVEDEEDMAIDYLGRDIGEALIPELHSKEKLERLKHNMLKRDWLSMYQQRPAEKSGDKFSEGMFQRYDGDPFVVRHNMNVYITVDPADSKRQGADYTAMCVIALGADGNYYLLDMIRERLDLGERAEKLMYLHRMWSPIAVGYESYGAQADIQYIRTVQEHENYRFPITKLSGTTMRKEERVERLIPDMNNGRWYFPHKIIHNTKQNEEYDAIHDMIHQEMIPFPLGKHDDGVDALSRIYDLPIMFPSGNQSFRGNSAQKVSPW